MRPRFFSQMIACARSAQIQYTTCLPVYAVRDPPSSTERYESPRRVLVGCPRSGARGKMDASPPLSRPEAGTITPVPTGPRTRSAAVRRPTVETAVRVPWAKTIRNGSNVGRVSTAPHHSQKRKRALRSLAGGNFGRVPARQSTPPTASRSPNGAHLDARALWHVGAFSHAYVTAPNAK